MSMTTLVILRFLGIFAAYTGVTLALPALMFRRILRGRSLAEQFLMCYTFGNFYIINICRFLLRSVDCRCISTTSIPCCCLHLMM